MGKAKRHRDAGHIRLTAGGLAGSSGLGEITLSGVNVIGLRACHQHTGLQLFLDHILKGREEGFSIVKMACNLLLGV